MVRVTLFHNPTAGDAPLTADQLTSILSDAGYQVRYQSTKDDLSAVLEDIGELAVVAGGDGTVAKVARALADTDISLAVLPLGTANNIGKALGVFGDIRDLVGSWPGASRRAIDIGVSSGPFGEERFLESVGSGAFAELVRRGRNEVDQTAAIVHRETDRALQLMASILREARAEDWQLELDDHDLSGSYLAVEAMNIPFVGPNIPLAGDAEMDDGELDLVLLAGDLTTHGLPEQAAVLGDACRGLRIPIVAVLGNHDHHSSRCDDVRTALEEGGVTILDRDHTILEIGETEVGIVGTKGFVGGFPGAEIADFGEPVLRQVYRETTLEVEALEHGLEAVSGCHKTVVLLHYAPTTDTLAGEPEPIWAFLGSGRLAAPIGMHRPDLVVHGHAHHGSARGAIGEVPVYNVAVHVTGQDFVVLDL